MRFNRQTTAVAALFAVGALALTGCSGGNAGDGGGDASGAGAKIAFLMPDLASTRYEEQDAPLFKAKVAELCADCEVIYQNADSDPAKQQQQADAAITQGATVLVLDAVDTTAAASIVTNAQAEGVTVITYDRPIPSVPADFYISFDNEQIGTDIATSLLTDLDGKVSGEQGILVVGGSPTDDAAGLILDGIHTAVDAGSVPVLAEFETPDWDPQKAQDWVSSQITTYGDKIVGVVAANDGTAGGSIAALKAAGIDPIPAVTGNDAEVAAIQRIIAGTQFNTISKPIATVAGAAAEAAVAFAKGETPEASGEVFGTPGNLFIPTVVTQENVKEVIFDGKIYTVAEICTADYAAACSALDIK